MTPMDLIVGTFNSPHLYTLRFDPKAKTLAVSTISPGTGGHSWLSLSPDGKTLYCTAWGEPKSSVAAFAVNGSANQLQLINERPVDGRPGYVCCSSTHVYSVGGHTGDVFTIEQGGRLGERIQSLDFVQKSTENMSEKRGAVAHGNFGGLRHGAHSCDLSPDGKSLYVADIGRNCVWVYGISCTQANGLNGHTPKPESHLSLQVKSIAPRSYDGPRHTWPHPNGNILYSLQEHSSMVDVFSIVRDEGGSAKELRLVGSGSILPPDQDRKDFWADEVRLSTGPDSKHPKYLFASTRGLTKETKGYVSVFELDSTGNLLSENAIDIWQTPTSGGIANAIEPAPWAVESEEHIQYLALTDSENGTVSILSFSGTTIEQVCIMALPDPSQQNGHATNGHVERSNAVLEAATAVWL